MLCMETIAVCFENRTKYTNTLCGQNVEFLNVESSGSWPGSAVGIASAYGVFCLQAEI
jgi:hypothetical protein